MAYNKADKADSPMKRRGGMRRRKKFAYFAEKITQSITKMSIN